MQGGMMEEWHQKLHNNTSPDDVVICEALIAYIDGGLDISKYWAHLEVRRPFPFKMQLRVVLSFGAVNRSVSTCRLKESLSSGSQAMTDPL
jgi:hypothetical protein